METQLPFQIHAQPDDASCGPTCLQAIYRYFSDSVPLKQVLTETGRLKEGGTLAVMLGLHALRRGYSALLYTYKLQVFDPTWFHSPEVDLAEKLRHQIEHKRSRKLQIATEAYLEFLRLGGRIRMEDLTAGLMRRYLSRQIPILAGLSATYLYGEPRELAVTSKPDDIRGYPTGHFVVLCGYDSPTRSVLVADPLTPNTLSRSHLYQVKLDRVICAILLGMVTYDSNLLIVRPSRRLPGARPVFGEPVVLAPADD